jgi:CHAD domain-containing protein
MLYPPELRARLRGAPSRPRRTGARIIRKWLPERQFSLILLRRGLCYTPVIPMRFPAPVSKIVSSPREGAVERGTDEAKTSVAAEGAALRLETVGSQAAGEAALADLHRLLGTWLAHEPGARLGHDPEELHQLRVTARRIDATLNLFKQHLSPALVKARKTAKSLLRSLGASRDLDVQLAGLNAYCDELPEEERRVLEPLKERLTIERARARTRMLRVLDSEPTRRWIQTLTAATAAPPAANDPGAATVATVMPQRMRQRFRRLRKAVRRLRADSSMDDYHKVRRRAKQLRYALDSGAVMCGKPADEMLRALRRMQDKLGAYQDAHMARSHLNALAADPACALPPATLFHMGRLAEHHTRVTSQAHSTVTKSWRKVRGRRWKALRARLGEFEHSAPQPANPLPASLAALGNASPAAEAARPSH